MARTAPDRYAEVDQLIEKRHAQRVANEGDRAREALWAGSVRRYHQERTEQFKRSWVDYHRHLQRVYTTRAQQHGERADFIEGLLTGGGV